MNRTKRKTAKMARRRLEALRHATCPFWASTFPQVEFTPEAKERIRKSLEDAYNKCEPRRANL